MELTHEVSETRARIRAARSDGRRIGLVPTMGALHAGHLSLIHESKRRDDFVVVSIFVNPTQFAPNEDFESYPRDPDRDLNLCREAGVGLVFRPTVSEVYSRQHATTVHVARLDEHLCGAGRPGHFDGVALVVGKLFNMVQPDAAYFGQKDAQQLAIVRQMARDLDFPIEIVGCPIVREPDGLALSSRNAHLSPEQRQQAPALYAALCEAAEAIARGVRDVSSLVDAVRKTVTKAGPCQIEYVSIVEPVTLQPVEQVAGEVLIALAVQIGSARLIDNLLVDPSPRE